MVSPSLAGVLAARRAALNQRVVETRHRMPGLDTAAFGAFVSHEIDAVCVAVDGADRHATERVVEAAFDIGLELVAQGLAGPAARVPWVNRAWQCLATPAAHLIASAPVDTLGAITNAVIRLGSVPGVRVDEWIDAVSALAARCESVEKLRSLGAVCAWKAGMTHLRHIALDHADHLGPELAAAALGASLPWPALRERLRNDGWWNPSTDAIDIQGQTIGGFSGLGGPFATPPEVRVGRDGFVAESAGRHFLLVADAFGAVVLPASPAEFAAATSDTARDVSITSRGARVHDTPVEFAVPADRMKAVANADSVAFFSPWSHLVRIVPARA
jgi:hypothetical protein